MVTAGYEAAVAPLGTALTEDQLALLWKMADEPVLCFDGDGAGRRAAYRAVDLALPHIKPGKSVRFALLPEGQDPDDLVRSGGREAISEVIGAARPLADMLWQRETEAGGFDTPERRAGLDQRVAEVTNAIGDPSVRKYYRQDLDERVRDAVRAAVRGADARARLRQRGPVRRPDRAGKERGKAAAGRAPREPCSAAPSARLAASPIVRGARSALPSREALILLAVDQPPLAAGNPRGGTGRARVPPPRRRPAAPGHPGCRRGPCADARPSCALRSAGATSARCSHGSRRRITHPSDWPAREGAAEEDVSLWWTHVVSLHRKSRTLHKELKDAELALGTEPSEENLAWLRDVQARLAALEGAEALIDGFGGPSGRRCGPSERGLVGSRVRQRREPEDRDSVHRVGGLFPRRRRWREESSSVWPVESGLIGA